MNGQKCNFYLWIVPTEPTFVWPGQHFSIVAEKSFNRNISLIILHTISWLTWAKHPPNSLTMVYSLPWTTGLCLYWWIRTERFSLLNFSKSLIWYSLFWKAVLLALRKKKYKKNYVTAHLHSKMQLTAILMPVATT